jgi:hypothetical protein
LGKREQARTALDQKLDELDSRLNDKITEVRTAIARTTDVKYQVQQRPWKMLGLSVGSGYIIGRMFSGRGRRRPSSAPAIDTAGPSRSGIIKGAVLGIMAALLREGARQVAPALIAYLREYSKRGFKHHNSGRNEWQPPAGKGSPEHTASHIR